MNRLRNWWRHVQFCFVFWPRAGGDYHIYFREKSADTEKCLICEFMRQVPEEDDDRYARIDLPF
jgi:hypothetical protein